MIKRGNFTKTAVLVVFSILLVASGVFADSYGLSEDIKKIITDFASTKGIAEQNITSIERVDFAALPDAVNIENIDDTHLAIYQVEYGGEKPVYVITASEEMFSAKSLAEDYEVLLLNFGFDGTMEASGFLETATGVEGSSEKGYVMMREGSITGISTTLEGVEGSGQIEIIILKNGEEINFENNFVINSSEVKKDYDVQSRGVVIFEPGDVISAYARAEGNVVWKDVITIVEITITKDL